MRVVVVGRGRVGTALTERLPGSTSIGVRGGIPATDIVLVAVPASAFAEVVGRLPAGVPALHTSGASGPDALAPHHPSGVFHPLMTFTGSGSPDLAGVAIRIDGDPAAVAAGRAVAARLGARPVHVPGDSALYHAAAVIAGNFSTVLLAEAARVLAAAGVDPEEAPGLLAPLALASVRNAAAGPAAALTGPAARGERRTLDAHRAALRAAGLAPQADLYDLLTERALQLVSRESGVDGDTT